MKHGVDWVKKLAISEEEKEAIFSGNAKQLLGME